VKINGSDYEITEDEATYFLTKAVKTLAGINQSDFHS
jgi:hypothetical protein